MTAEARRNAILSEEIPEEGAAAGTIKTYYCDGLPCKTKGRRSDEGRIFVTGDKEIAWFRDQEHDDVRWDPDRMASLTAVMLTHLQAVVSPAFEMPRCFIIGPDLLQRVGNENYWLEDPECAALVRGTGVDLRHCDRVLMLAETEEHGILLTTFAFDVYSPFCNRLLVASSPAEVDADVGKAFGRTAMRIVATLISAMCRHHAAGPSSSTYFSDDDVELFSNPEVLNVRYCRTETQLALLVMAETLCLSWDAFDSAFSMSNVEPTMSTNITAELGLNVGDESLTRLLSAQTSRRLMIGDPRSSFFVGEVRRSADRQVITRRVPSTARLAVHFNTKLGDDRTAAWDDEQLDKLLETMGQKTLPPVSAEPLRDVPASIPSEPENRERIRILSDEILDPTGVLTEEAANSTIQEFAHARADRFMQWLDEGGEEVEEEIEAAWRTMGRPEEEARPLLLEYDGSSDNEVVQQTCVRPIADDRDARDYPTGHPSNRAYRTQAAYRNYTLVLRDIMSIVGEPGRPLRQLPWCWQRPPRELRGVAPQEDGLWRPPLVRDIQQQFLLQHMESRETRAHDSAAIKTTKETESFLDPRRRARGENPVAPDYLDVLYQDYVGRWFGNSCVMWRISQDRMAADAYVDRQSVVNGVFCSALFPIIRRFPLTAKVPLELRGEEWHYVPGLFHHFNLRCIRPRTAIAWFAENRHLRTTATEPSVDGLLIDIYGNPMFDPSSGGPGSVARRTRKLRALRLALDVIASYICVATVASAFLAGRRSGSYQGQRRLDLAYTIIEDGMIGRLSRDELSTWEAMREWLRTRTNLLEQFVKDIGDNWLDLSNCLRGIKLISMNNVTLERAMELIVYDLPFMTPVVRVRSTVRKSRFIAVPDNPDPEGITLSWKGPDALEHALVVAAWRRALPGAAYPKGGWTIYDENVWPSETLALQFYLNLARREFRPGAHGIELTTASWAETGWAVPEKVLARNGYSGLALVDGRSKEVLMSKMNDILERPARRREHVSLDGVSDPDKQRIIQLGSLLRWCSREASFAPVLKDPMEALRALEAPTGEAPSPTQIIEADWWRQAIGTEERVRTVPRPRIPWNLPELSLIQTDVLALASKERFAMKIAESTVCQERCRSSILSVFVLTLLEEVRRSNIGPVPSSLSSLSDDASTLRDLSHKETWFQEDKGNFNLLSRRLNDPMVSVVLTRYPKRWLSCVVAARRAAIAEAWRTLRTVVLQSERLFRVLGNPLTFQDGVKLWLAGVKNEVDRKLRLAYSADALTHSSSLDAVADNEKRKYEKARERVEKRAKVLDAVIRAAADGDTTTLYLQQKDDLLTEARSVQREMEITMIGGRRMPGPKLRYVLSCNGMKPKPEGSREERPGILERIIRYFFSERSTITRRLAAFVMYPAHGGTKDTQELHDTLFDGITDGDGADIALKKIADNVKKIASTWPTFHASALCMDCADGKVIKAKAIGQIGALVVTILPRQSDLSHAALLERLQRDELELSLLLDRLKRMDPRDRHETFSRPAVSSLFDLLCHDISATETYLRMVTALRPPNEKVLSRLRECIDDANASYKEATEAQREKALRLNATAKIRGNAIIIWEEALKTWERSSAEVTGALTSEQRRAKVEEFALRACYDLRPGLTERSWIGVASSWMFLPHDAKHEGDRHIRWLDREMGGGRGPRSLCMRTGPTVERSVLGIMSRTRSLGDDWCKEADAPKVRYEDLEALEELEAHYVDRPKEEGKGVLREGLREFREALPLMRSDAESTTAQTLLGLEQQYGWCGSRYVVVACSSLWETVPTCAVESLVSRAAWWAADSPKVDPFTGRTVGREITAGDPRAAEAHLDQVESAIGRISEHKSRLDDHVVAFFIVYPYGLGTDENVLTLVDEAMLQIETTIGGTETEPPRSLVQADDDAKLIEFMARISQILRPMVQEMSTGPEPVALIAAVRAVEPNAAVLVADPIYWQHLSPPRPRSDPRDMRTRSWWMGSSMVDELSTLTGEEAGMPLFMAVQLAILAVWTCEHMSELASDAYRLAESLTPKKELQKLHIAASIRDWRSKLKGMQGHAQCKHGKVLDESLRGLESLSSIILRNLGPGQEWSEWADRTFASYMDEVTQVRGDEGAALHQRWVEKKAYGTGMRNLLYYIVGTTMVCPATEEGVRRSLEAANLRNEEEILGAYDKKDDISQRTMVTPITAILTKLGEAHQDLEREWAESLRAIELARGKYAEAMMAHIDATRRRIPEYERIGGRDLPEVPTKWTCQSYDDHIDKVTWFVESILAKSQALIWEMKDLPRLPPEGPRTFDEAAEKLVELHSNLRPRRYDTSPCNVAIIRLSPS